MTPEMIEVAARTIIIEHYAAYDIRMQEGVARIMAKAVLTAALAVMWRPIATAPKDGTNILLSSEVWTCAPIMLGWWDDVHDIWTTEAVSLQQWPAEDQPTKWQPLPDPPKETA